MTSHSDSIREKAYSRLQDDIGFCIDQVWSHLVAYFGLDRLREMDLKNQLLYSIKHQCSDYIVYNYSEEEITKICDIFDELNFQHLKSVFIASIDQV